MDKESLEHNLYVNDITTIIRHNFSLTLNPPIKPKDSGSFRMKVVEPLTIHTPPSPHMAYLHRNAHGWHLEEIDMTWAHLEKKRTKLRTYTNYREENPNSDWRRRCNSLRRRQKIQGDTVRDLTTASECSRPKETLKDSVSQDKEDYSTSARSIRYCFIHNSFILTQILTIQ
nr:hypothetical protein [Tanacetum cinerariifolium]